MVLALNARMLQLLPYSLPLIAFGFYWLFQRRPGKRSNELNKLAFVKFEGEETPERYITDSKSLLHRGYLQVNPTLPKP